LPAEAQTLRFINADLISAGLANFHERYRKEVDSWALYDSSGMQPKMIDWSKALREEGEKFHKAGKHDESMKALGEAKKMLGI